MSKQCYLCNETKDVLPNVVLLDDDSLQPICEDCQAWVHECTDTTPKDLIIDRVLEDRKTTKRFVASASDDELRDIIQDLGLGYNHVEVQDALTKLRML
jgi:hypothetical protein